jgi:hypothetical protein
MPVDGLAGERHKPDSVARDAPVHETPPAPEGPGRENIGRKSLSP